MRIGAPHPQCVASGLGAMSKPLGGDRENRGAWSRGLTDALRLLERGRRGPATEADAPPPSLFPMTPAARQALRMWRQKAPSASERYPRNRKAGAGVGPPPEPERAGDTPEEIAARAEFLRMTRATPDNVIPIRKGE